MKWSSKIKRKIGYKKNEAISEFQNPCFLMVHGGSGGGGDLEHLRMQGIIAIS